MRNRLLSLLLILIVNYPNISHASSCAIVNNDVAAKNAKVIFTGKVISIDTMNRDKYPKGQRYDICGDKYIIFNPSKVWKGEIDINTKIYSADGCMGLGGYFYKDKEYLVYANEAKKKGWYGKGSHKINEVGQLYTTICRRTTALGSKNAEKDIEYLNKNFKNHD